MAGGHSESLSDFVQSESACLRPPFNTRTYTCAICAEVAEGAGAMSAFCGCKDVMYHVLCLSQWFLSQRDNNAAPSCPTCRQQVSVPDQTAWGVVARNRFVRAREPGQVEERFDFGADLFQPFRVSPIFYLRSDRTMETVVHRPQTLQEGMFLLQKLFAPVGTDPIFTWKELLFDLKWRHPVHWRREDLDRRREQLPSSLESFWMMWSSPFVISALNCLLTAINGFCVYKNFYSLVSP